MIATEKLGKRYGEKTVLSSVTLELPKEKIIAFIGGNGTGKSTLLSLITRTLPKSEGKVMVDGTELSDWNNRELAKKLSILRQANDLNIRLTIRELVAFGRFPYTRGRLNAEDEKQIDRALDYLRLKPLEHRYLDELSGGQRQMAFIAMIIAQDTEYIFLDEPLNNLDMRHSVQIMKVLRRLVTEAGKTVMVVIHDINFVVSHADYVIALKEGKVIAQGDTGTIIRPEVLKTSMTWISRSPKSMAAPSVFITAELCFFNLEKHHEKETALRFCIRSDTRSADRLQQAVRTGRKCGTGQAGYRNLADHHP